MSINTWVEEFYPAPEDGGLRWPDWQSALESAILKWSGATESNLKKHSLEKSEMTRIKDDLDRTFSFSSYTCGLCDLTEDISSGGGSCYSCPIYAANGRSCDSPSESDDLSEFGQWTTNDNPYPMIRLLDKTKEYMKTHHFDYKTKEWRENGTT